MKINNMSRYAQKSICALMLATIAFYAPVASAQTVNVDARSLIPRVAVSFSPPSGSFTEGSTFEVPILLNSRGSSINGIDLQINFDHTKLQIIQSSNGKSIIGVWVEPPKYDNTRGTASFVGVITGGITTASGLISAITFKALRTGPATVSINSNSSIYLNNGLGTPAAVDFGRANYSILPKAPEGVTIFSETHPNQGDWYNNNSPILSWERAPGVSEFSFMLDDKPSTIPDSIAESSDTSKTYEGLSDGLWYFHIKANKSGAWGTTGHFLMRIDTTPPAEFTPEANYLVAAAITIDRTFVSFFTTDNLSGVDHYEAGVIDKNQPATESPAFVQVESPYQVSAAEGSDLYVIIRAVDKAGNVRDESLHIQPPLGIVQFIEKNLIYILLFIILLGLVILISHYLFGHHIVRYLKRAFALANREAEEHAHLEPEKKDGGVPLE